MTKVRKVKPWAEVVHENGHLPVDRDTTRRRRWRVRATVRTRSEWHAARGRIVIVTLDTNTHGPFPRLLPGSQLSVGRGIDKVLVSVPNGWQVELVEELHCDLTIDGHNGLGARVKVTAPDGTFRILEAWTANLGRHETRWEFLSNVERLVAHIGARATVGLQEIDEADAPNEHRLLRKVTGRGYAIAGKDTAVPVLVSRALTIRPRSRRVTFAAKGLAKVTPHRVVTEVVYQLHR